MWCLFLLGALLIAIGMLRISEHRDLRKQFAYFSSVERYTIAELEDLHRRAMATQGAGSFHRRCWVGGIVECDEPLVGPFSGKACVAYRLVEVQPTSEGENYAEYQAQRVPFWLRDDTGRVLVDPRHGALNLPMSTTGSGQGRQAEQALKVGQHIYVLGSVFDENGALRIGPSAHDPGAWYRMYPDDEHAAVLGKHYDAESPLAAFMPFGMIMLGIVLCVVGVIG